MWLSLYSVSQADESKCKIHVLLQFMECKCSLMVTTLKKKGIFKGAITTPPLTKMVLVVAFKLFQRFQWLLSPPLTPPHLPESWDQRCSSPGHRFAYSSHQVSELRQNCFWITYHQPRKYELGFNCVQNIASAFHSTQFSYN